MPALIGGSPSTGSSLLRQMLNRHSAIYCGPESQLFTHPQLFEKWDKAKYHIQNKPLLTSPDMHLIRGVNMIGHEQGWSSDNLHALINSSHDFRQFCEAYFSRCTILYGKDVWMDKTPSNVLSFNAFLKTWDDGLVVHIVRDPLDIVASLISRGLSLFLAVSRYLLNTAHALSSHESENYILLQYEKLVTSPESAMEPLLTKLKLKYEPVMLQGGNPQLTEADQMTGWRSSEIGRPNQKSVGRFNSLTEEQQVDIIASLHSVNVNPQYGLKHGLSHLDCKAVSDSLGFVIPSIKAQAKHGIMKKLRAEQWRYRKQCLWQRRFFFERARPVLLV